MEPGMKPHDGTRPFTRFDRAEVDPHQLCRAAADVHHQKLLRLGGDERRAGDYGKAGFFLGLNDLQREAGVAPHLPDELARVLGTAAGLRRDKPHALHVVAFDLLLANTQSRDRAPHGRTA